MNKNFSEEILPNDLIKKYMQIAIDEANLDNETPSEASDVPVGCVIIGKSGEILAKAHNTRKQKHSVTGHAEINAINEVSKKYGDYRLEDATVFVTLEPCPMCAGALASARPKALYYGAPNTENGSCGTVFNILNSHTNIYGGINASEISAQLSDFFEKVRKKKLSHMF